MKPLKTKTAAATVPVTLPPVFPQTLHALRPNKPAGNLPAQPAKRDNIFSKSRDRREDRGERQMKTSHNAQTFPHAR
jgi:hypothetical protein